MSVMHGILKVVVAPVAIVVAAALGACSTTPVGPNYQVPAEAVALQPAAGAAFSESSTAFADAPLPDHWWRLYQDPLLDRLIERALAHNTDLRVAMATLERERAIEDEVAGAKSPTIGLKGGPTYGHPSGMDELAPGYRPPNAYEYGAGVSLSYQLDLFGGIRRAIEASKANGDAAQAGVDLVRVNVAAGTARAYAEICSTGLRLQSAEHSTDLQRQAVDISERLQAAGRVGVIDAARARSQLQQLEAAIPTLQSTRQSALYRLATLTGALPQDFPREVASCTAPPHVAGTMPVGDGAALLRRRPDVRQAERALAAATAGIGIATADLYPRITLGLSGDRPASPTTSVAATHSAGASAR
jgi:NodT family efflux transporter outer membrane factor (OMF) lipoprotein